MPNTKIKICGITRGVDAEFAEGAGADFVGVILAAGFGRTLDVSEAREVMKDVRRAVRVTVRVDDSYDQIMADAEVLGAGVVQLHGNEPPELAARIQEGGHLVWKAVRVRSGGDLTTAVERFEGAVDGLLLDGWHATRVGGSGTSFPWGDVAPARAQIHEGMGLIAAGGLDPENVAEAIATLRPTVVDVSSGVEAGMGEKDPERIRAFVRAVRDRP